MWKNIVQLERPHIIWRMRIAWSIPKAINTHSEYVILIYFALQQILQERTSVVRYTYCPSFSTLKMVVAYIK